MAQLVEVARAPRPSGSVEHTRVAGLLRQRLSDLGFAEGPEPFDRVHTVLSGLDGADATRVDNVVARLEGTASTGAILVVAHYDTKPTTPGAGDGGIGVAAVLEALRALTLSTPLRNDVIVLLADGGALGDLGVRAFLEGHPWSSEVSLALSLEAFGVSGPSWIVGSSQAAETLVARMGLRARDPLMTSLASVLPVTPASESPRATLAERGIPALGLVVMGGRATNGTALAAAGRVAERTLSHQGTQLLSLLREAGEADLGLDAMAPASAISGPSIAGVGVIAWPGTWSLPTTIGLVLGWLLLMPLLRWRGADLRGVGAGAVLALLVIAASVGVSRALTDFLARTHAEFGRVAGGVYEPGPHLAALVVAATGIAVLLYGIARLRFGRVELYAGALALPLAAVVWLAVSIPAVLPVPQLALGVGLAHALLLTLLPSRPWSGALAAVLGLTGALALLASAMPSAEWAAAVMWPGSDLLLGAALAVGLALFLPAFDGMLAPGVWCTPAAAAVVTGALIMMALPGVRGAERHPELTSLGLLLDATDDGLDAGTTASAEPDTVVAWTRPVRRAPGMWLTVPGPGEDWARSWAVAGETSERGTSGLLLPFNDDWVVAGGGPPANVALPRVDVVGWSSRGTTRTVALEIRSGLGGAVTGVHLPEEVQGSVRSVQGRTLPASADVRELRWWGDTTTTPLRLTLRVPAGEGTLDFDVIEHHLDPGLVLGPRFFVRNETVVPDAARGSDRVVQRTRVTLWIGGDSPPGGADADLAGS